MGKLLKNFCERVFLKVLIPATKMVITFKITYRFFFSQVLLTGRFTRSFFDVDTVTFKLLRIPLSC